MLLKIAGSIFFCFIILGGVWVFPQTARAEGCADGYFIPETNSVMLNVTEASPGETVTVSPVEGMILSSPLRISWDGLYGSLVQYSLGSQTFFLVPSQASLGEHHVIVISPGGTCGYVAGYLPLTVVASSRGVDTSIRSDAYSVAGTGQVPPAALDRLPSTGAGLFSAASLLAFGALFVCCPAAVRRFNR